MKEILLRELFRNSAEYADKEILIKGWVRNNRSSNKFGFIELNDGSFFKSVQVVYEEEFIANFEEIAKACNYSPAYIKKVFAKYSDCGIHNYFLKLKLQKAILLFQDGKTIQQTSNLLSFSNTNYFGVVFKREFGMSPRNYIKEHIETV